MRNAVMVIKRVKYLILITIIGVIYIEPVLGFNPESETVTVSFNPEFKNDGTEKWIEETNNLSRNFTIYYPINLWKILPEYADNAATLENINNFISRCLADTTLIIKHIKITGSCSVDGSVAFNNKLSAERFSHFMKYLDKKYPGLYDYPVTSEALGENWNLFYSQIEGFSYEPGYEYVLQVRKEKIDNPPADGSSIRYRLVKVVSKTQKESEGLPGLD